MKYWIAVFISVTLFALIGGSSVFADTSLQLQPLEYRESLKKGESKKGFIDVTNPLSVPTDVSFHVQGFRQINDKGELTFYTDPQLSSAIQLDYNDAQIPAKKTLRLYFIIDGSKLPTGDVFAAIFAKNTVAVIGDAVPSVQIGTLLLITNETPALHQATITHVDVPWLTIGESVKGKIGIKNIAPRDSSNGFFPKIVLDVWPLGATRTLTGPLIYSGNTREVVFSEFNNRFGIYRLSATHGDSHSSHWIIVITGVWRWIAPTTLGMLIITSLLLMRRRHRRTAHKSR